MLLPPSIEANFREHAETDAPVAAVRGLTDMIGNLGESYLLSDGKQLHVHSRTVGKDWVSYVGAPPDDFHVEERSPYLFLIGSFPAGDMEFKFSSYDKETVQALVTSLEPGATAPNSSAEAEVGSAEAEAEKAVDPAPMNMFAAAMHAVAQADLIVDESETLYIRRTVGDEKQIRQGFQLWQKLGTRGVIDWLAQRFDHDERLCVVANVIELGMADGTLRSIEKETVKWFCDGLEIDGDTVQAIYDVLIIKNRVAVFAE